MYWCSINVKVYRENVIGLSRTLTLKILKDPRERAFLKILPRFFLPKSRLYYLYALIHFKSNGQRLTRKLRDDSLINFLLFIMLN